MLVTEHSFKCVKPVTAKGMRDTFLEHYNCIQVKVKAVNGGFEINAKTVGPYRNRFDKE